MGKVDINKKQKKNALLQTAFDLFRDKGFAKNFGRRNCSACKCGEGNLLFIF